MNLFKRESLYHLHIWKLTFLFLLKETNLKINSVKLSNQTVLARYCCLPSLSRGTVEVWRSVKDLLAPSQAFLFVFIEWKVN